MFGLEMLDVVIGLSLIYLMLGLVCMTVNELIAQAMGLRAQTLFEGIRNILADPEAQGLAGDFYRHHLIKSLYRDDRKPSYIPSHTFAQALIDLVARDRSSGQMLDLKDAVEMLQNDRMKEVLRVFIDRAEGDLHKVHESVERWYNDATERMSGWYKQKTQAITISFALLITALTNADTITLATALSRDSALRAALVAQAQHMAERGSVTPAAEDSASPVSAAASDSAAAGIAVAVREIQKLGLPIGWQYEAPSGWGWANKIIGLLLTAFAVSLGAPFWFDVLSRVINIRGVGKAPK
jgi:hypothetical protein